ncbi:hypothetical protein HWV62_26162 [Athelia sp. TMB]|nr:hypothetical protein HWV62_26162 [Athelia sp. TMB]
MLSIQELLNPMPPAHNYQPPFHRFNASNPPELPDQINNDLSSRAPPPPRSLQHEPPSTPQYRNPSNLATPSLYPYGLYSLSQFDGTLLSTQFNIRLNNKTKLSTLYHYKHDTVLEYPRTSDTPNTSVGHLFELTPSQWSHPRLNFAYSQGPPKGRTKEGSYVYCSILRDDETGEEVPCQESHFTCQGCKICPFANLEAARIPHTQVTQELLKLRIQQSQRLHNTNSAEQALFEKTLSVYRAFKVHGCLGPPVSSPNPPPISSPTEWETQLQKFRRGAAPKLTCSGKLIFDYNCEGKAFVRCEHFSARPGGLRDHLCTFEVSSGLYDADYLEALFEGDAEAIDSYEYAARDEGYGPLASCDTVANFNTQKMNCRE